MIKALAFLVPAIYSNDNSLVNFKSSGSSVNDRMI